jgi:glyoxylase I family protein
MASPFQENVPIQLHGSCPLLMVYDMPTSLRFYRDLLGFDLVSSAGPGNEAEIGWAFLRLGSTEIMLNTYFEPESRPAVRDDIRQAHHGDTVLYFACSNLDDSYKHMIAQGLAVTKPEVLSYGMRQISLNDPDGYSLCFHWPHSEATKAQWREQYNLG